MAPHNPRAPQHRSMSRDQIQQPHGHRLVQHVNVQTVPPDQRENSCRRRPGTLATAMQCGMPKKIMLRGNSTWLAALTSAAYTASSANRRKLGPCPQSIRYRKVQADADEPEKQADDHAA